MVPKPKGKKLSNAPATEEQPTSLICLPPEIRQMCYELVEPSDLPNLVRANKQIYSESHHLISERCTFNIFSSHVHRGEKGKRGYRHALQCIKQLPSEAPSVHSITLHAPYVLVSSLRAAAPNNYEGFKKAIDSLRSLKLSLTDITVYLYLPNDRFSVFQGRQIRKLAHRVEDAFALGTNEYKRTTLVLCYEKLAVRRSSSEMGLTPHFFFFMKRNGTKLDNLRLRFSSGAENYLPLHVDQLLALPESDERREMLSILYQLQGPRNVLIDTYIQKGNRRIYLPNKHFEPRSIEGLQAYLEQNIPEA